MVTSITTTLNTSASGTSRQLFYWISMLVVTLIAAITVMEAFGVYFFPHGSWSEGINPKALNNFGRAIGEDIPFLMLFLIQMWLIFVTKTKDFGRHLLNFTP